LVNGKIKFALVLAALSLSLPLVVLIGVNVAAVEDPVTESHAVAAEGASSAEVAIALGAGELVLGGGANDLMDGTFTYSDDDWQPVIDYQVEGGVGRLAVGQGSGPGFVAAEAWDDVENDWEIRLAGSLPLSLSVELGAGQSILDLGELNLTDATIRTGAGETTVDLVGSWDHDVRVSIDGGAGDVTILVPEGGNVELNASVGIGEVATSGFTEQNGSLVNEDYEAGAPTIVVTVTGGMGNVQVIAVPLS
jgi:hypothetical protein